MAHRRCAMHGTLFEVNVNDEWECPVCVGKIAPVDPSIPSILRYRGYSPSETRSGLTPDPTAKYRGQEAPVFKTWAELYAHNPEPFFGTDRDTYGPLLSDEHVPLYDDQAVPSEFMAIALAFRAHEAALAPAVADRDPGVSKLDREAFVARRAWDRMTLEERARWEAEAVGLELLARKVGKR